MLDIFERVRVKETGDLGMVVAVMSKRQPKPYAVRITDAGVSSAAAALSKTGYYSEDELERVERCNDHAKPDEQPPAKSKTQLDRIEADTVEHRIGLAIVHAELNALAKAIDRRPTGWQLFWIGTIALFALSAAMETAWMPDPAELARIAAGAPVVLRILGTAHPPVMVEVGEVPK